MAVATTSMTFPRRRVVQNFARRFLLRARLVDMPVIVRHRDRGALRLDYRHDQGFPHLSSAQPPKFHYTARARKEIGPRERLEARAGCGGADQGLAQALSTAG
jgi:hypothetical protein